MNEGTSRVTRRKFLQDSGKITAGTGLALTMGIPNLVFGNRGDNTLKIGLIGCGGRGSGAADQALSADPNVVLYAVCDIFQDRIDGSLKSLKEIHANKIQVDKSRQFTEFEDYRKVIDLVDVVLLATTPVFRPEEIEACVDAGKHFFYEKPVAIDAPGIRRVIAAAKKAKEKKLSIVSGLCFRHDLPKQALFGKVLDGAIGDVKVVSSIRYGGAWHEPVRDPRWTDMEYNIRFWYYKNWLSGDFNVEQFVHSMDMISWALGDITPIRAIGTGGRQQRVEEKYGNIYDHFATSFEYENGAQVFTDTRQQKGVAGQNNVTVFGSEGNAYYEGKTHKIVGKTDWSYNGELNNMYQEEHDYLFKSIRNNQAVNDGIRAANSTMMAILSRMVAYTGKSITWEEAMNSTVKLGPEKYTRDLKYEGPGVAVPGITKEF